MVNLPTIAIIGTGSMGGAILTGLLAPGVNVAGGIRVTNRTAAKAEALATEGAAAAVKAAAEGYADANVDAAANGFVSYALEETPDANALAVAGARIVLIGVKPYMVSELLESIADSLEPDALVVSVAAGVTIATMEALVAGPVARAMPNTPAVVGLAVTGLSAGTRTTDEDMELARTLFETVGSVLVVPESKIDALSTISGSGPAYVFYLVEELTRTAVGLGFSAEEAAVMVNGTFRGASELLAAGGGVGPAELRRRVTSPGGTTERAIAELQGGDLKGLFDRATAAALARAKEMAAG